MSLLDQLRERIAAAVAPRRNDRPYIRSGGNRNIGAVQTGNELQASLKGTVYACLQHRANALAGVKFQSYIEKNYEREELGRNHWTSELLANPNPYFTRSQVFSYIENWLSINGNAFIWTPTNGYRVPLQMWVLNPTRMRVIRGTDNFIEGYVYQSAQDGNIAIPEKEVIHLAKVHPAARPEELIGMNIFGVGLVSAALDYANIDNEVSAYLMRLFENNTAPPIIATFPERFDQQEWEQLKARWNEELPDFRLRALLGGGMGLALPPKGELSTSYDAVSRDTRAQIAQVFGVPPGMLNGEFQNKATAEVQWAIFRQNTIDPEALYIAEEFTRHFKRWDESILIESEAYTYADPDMDMRQEEFELKWGLKTINEARTDRGYDKVKDGDTPLIALGYMPLQSVTNAPPLPVVPRKLQRGYNDIERGKLPLITADAKDLFWRQFDGLTADNAEDIQAAVNKAIKELEIEVMNRIAEGEMSLANLDISDKNYMKFADAVTRACDSIQKRLIESLDLDPDNIPPTIQEYIEKITLESSQQIRDSIDIIKEEIQAVVNKNADATKPELEEALKSKFKTLSTSRAKTIAQTTSANATSGVQYTVYKENGFDMMWLSQRDGDVRPAHMVADGQMQDSQGYFTVGGEKTTRPLGAGLSAGNSINCRCQLFPVKS